MPATATMSTIPSQPPSVPHRLLPASLTWKALKAVKATGIPVGLTAAGNGERLPRPSLTKQSNGTKAWVTNLSGNHNNNEFSYLYSPCFDLSSLTQPVLSFSHIFRTEDNCNCDFHWVEYSTDGSNWNKLGTTWRWYQLVR